MISNHNTTQLHPAQTEALAPPRRAGGVTAAVLAAAVLVLLLGFLAGAVPAATAQDRSYELVSPADKGGGEVDLEAITTVATSRASDDGNAVAYASFTPFPVPGLSGAPTRHQYVSVREASGWSTRGVSPPLAPTGGITDARIRLLSADLSRVVVGTPARLTPATPPPGEWGFYQQDHGATPTTYALLNEPASPLPPAGAINVNVAAGTGDLGHLVFDSPREYLPGAAQSVYEWADGGLRVASVLPSGEFGPRAVAGARSMSGGLGVDYPGSNLLSADGSRIYFTVRSGDSRGLYVRENAAETKVVSVSERDGDDPEAPTPDAEFLHAAATGSVAFFASPHPLTEGATAAGDERRDLYRWDAEAPLGERLTDLTIQDPAGGGVLGLAAGTDDGSRLYFVATGELAEGAEADVPNLYLWEQGAGVRHVAGLDAADEAVWAVTRGRAQADLASRGRNARLNEDGSRLLFASHAQLTGHDNAGHRQIYLYDAVDGEITCVSCSSLREPSTASAALLDLGPSSAQTPIAPLVLPRNLSRDGNRAFFNTPERLLPTDTNGRTDVYEWENGELSLITDGDSAHDAKFLAASADGGDVFFVTRARLVSADVDTAIDLYDAKVGGGFPELPRPQPCRGDECQGPVLAPPADLTPGSSRFQGSDNSDNAGSSG